jgi:hypothetical protein
MDFFTIKEKVVKNKNLEIFPDFNIIKSKDLMVRGKAFYAIWSEEVGLWSTNEYDVQKIVDKALMDYKTKLEQTTDSSSVHALLMNGFLSNSWKQYKAYLASLPDNYHQLDECLTFQNDDIKKKDYVSKRLPYSLEEGSTKAYDELVSTLYEEEERAKLEWAIGSVVAGEGKDIQKFVVLYGEAGAGKSTMLNIIQKLFVGYYTTFEAKALASSTNAFATEVFKNNALVAIQHDGDLSKIEDNTKLNSIVAHEEMTMNEKYKASYTAKANCFLFMATNKPVKITDAKSGIIRRLIDVKPSGKKIAALKYQDLMSQIDFELGAIAYKCKQRYLSMGKNYYAAYRPLEMILQTDVFFNFMESNYDLLSEQNGISLQQAYSIYKTYCDEALVEFKLPRHKFREELRNYFETFDSIVRLDDGRQVRSYYSGFKKDKFKVGEIVKKEEHPSWLVLDSDESVFDKIASDYIAQYANEKEIPSKKWSLVATTLNELDTTKLHYVKMPLNHIVIDFDIKDSDGNKSSEKNLEAATKFPPTYAEYSKSQTGLHLHYFYEGDPKTLSNLYNEGIEIKVFIGDSSLRRKLSKCNTFPIATIKGGLPLKGEKVINTEVIKNEQSLRKLIIKNLNKEIHPSTKPSIDFIYTILEEAYKSGIPYDLTDLRSKVLSFAMNSTNQAKYCIHLVGKMHFKSEEISLDKGTYTEDEIVFFDVEVFPNLLVICWKKEGSNNPVNVMINPSSQDVEKLFKMKLVGFNNRRFDNHILYARYIGYDLGEIYKITKRIIGNNGSSSGLFGEAYGLSYADIYDFSSIKQSLKKFQLDLGIHHQELGIPWDNQVTDEQAPLVIEYCMNDVISTEAVFNDRKQDFIARQILADLSGLTINDTTQQHTARIIFGNDPKPQEKFIYTDLSKIFPGYKYENGVSTYKGEITGEGGYVYSEPGYYENVALLDVASMHPTSIQQLNLFGIYTDNFNQLMNARLAIKRKQYDKAKTMLGGVLEKYLTSPEQSEALSYALKIVINIVYGLTSASFSNKFKDPRNIDNIVAKRGALFMIDLKQAVQEKGFQVVHIKTDSIKIPNATPEIIDFIFAFGEEYGYKFEHETTFEKFCLVNDAVYIAKDEKGKWKATGAEFAHPYIFKTLFSKEPIKFEDMCETKNVTTALYLDMNEGFPEDQHNYVFVGKTGSFCPIKPGFGGGILLREKEGKYDAANGTKNYRWLEGEVVKKLNKEDDIDLNYFRELVDDAIDHLSKFVNFDLLRD